MRWQLVLSALLFFSFSCALFLWLPGYVVTKEGDAKGYYARARLFAQTNKLSEKRKLPPVGFGYPLLLGAWFKLMGDAPVSIVVINILLSLLCLLSLFRITNYLFSTVAASFLLCSFPLNIGFLVYTQCALTEVVLATLYAFFIENMVLFFKTEKALNMLFAGLLLAASLVVKPAAWFYGIFLSLLFFLVALWYGESRRAVSYFILSFFAGTFLYLLCNWLLFGVFDFPRVMQRNLLTLFLPKVYASIHRTTFLKAESALRVLPYLERWKLLLKSVKMYPFTAVSLWILNIIKTMFGFFSYHLALLVGTSKTGGSFFAMQGSLLRCVYLYLFGQTQYAFLKMLAVIELAWSCIRWFCLIVLGIAWIKNREYFYLLFFMSFIGYFLAITGADGCARLRMMIEPVLIVLAAGGFEKVYWYVQEKLSYKKIQYGEQV